MSSPAENENRIQELAHLMADAAGSSPHPRVTISGGGTKPELAARFGATADPPWQELSTRDVTGIIQYQPGEFTITAYAGTPLAELDAALAEKGQYLPFDPPRLGRGNQPDCATLGGAVASGINGPRRWRYGGARDFTLETRWIDGLGKVRVGGRRVVKNAAGFDIPKLMTGSCGRLGLMVDLTLKVFPRPPETTTIHVFSENLDAAAATLSQVAMAPWEIDALEIQPDSSLLIRLSGESDVITQHGTRLQQSIQNDCSDFLVGEEEQQVWNSRHQWIWNDPGKAVLRVPLNLRTMLDLDEELDEMEIDRCYGSAGTVAWIKWQPQSENPGTRLNRIAKLLRQFQLNGMLVRVPDSLRPCHPGLIIGKPFRNLFYSRIKQVFDPQSLLGEFDAS